MQILKINSPEAIQQKIREYIKTNEEARFVHRLHTVLLKIDNENQSCDSLAELLGHSSKTISNWIKKLNDAGDLEVLRERPKPGRRPKLSAQQLSELKATLTEIPGQSGIPSNTWDGPSLSLYIEEKYNIYLSVRQCQRLLRQLGFSQKRPVPVLVEGNKTQGEKD